VLKAKINPHPVSESVRRVSLRRLRQRPKSVKQNCESSLLDFYKKPVVDLSIVFGYKDARPALFVGDRYEKSALVERLLEPCVSTDRACGFTRDRAQEPEMLSRIILGPDDKPKTIRIRITESSVGPNDEANRSDPEQSRQSSHARQAFIEGLSHAEAVFYIGHARNGGGPDFSPPQIRKDGHVDYSWYESRRPGLSELLKDLKASAHPPQLLGLFSCFADRHFSKQIRSAAPGVALLTSSGWLYYQDALSQVASALDDLFSLRCPGGVEGLNGFFPKSLPQAN
jgi:hypothetical protein